MVVTLKNGTKLLLILGLVAASAVGCRKPPKPQNGDDGSTVLDPTYVGGSETGGGFYPAETPPPRRGDVGLPVAVNLEPVYFQFDSARLSDAELYKADRAAALLNENPSYTLAIEGHCDERGTAEYNLALGERRAQAVRAYLLNLGIADSRIKTASYGEEKPVASGHSESDWSRNRRAEFVFFE